MGRHHRSHAADAAVGRGEQQCHLRTHAVAGGADAGPICPGLLLDPVQQRAVVLHRVDDEAFVGRALAPQVQVAQQLAGDQRPFRILAVAMQPRIEGQHHMAGPQGMFGHQVRVLDRGASLELGLPPAPMRATHRVQGDQHGALRGGRHGLRRVRRVHDAPEHGAPVEAGVAQRLRPCRRRAHRHRLGRTELHLRRGPGGVGVRVQRRPLRGRDVVGLQGEDRPPQGADGAGNAEQGHHDLPHFPGVLELLHCDSPDSAGCMAQAPRKPR